MHPSNDNYASVEEFLLLKANEILDRKEKQITEYTPRLNIAAIVISNSIKITA